MTSRLLARTVLGLCVSLLIAAGIAFSLAACAAAPTRAAAPAGAPTSGPSPAPAPEPVYPASPTTEFATPPSSMAGGDSKPSEPAHPSREEEASKMSATAGDTAALDAGRTPGKTIGSTGEAAPMPMAVSTPESRPSPSQSGLKAGFSDDNEQYNLFVKFLDEYRSTPHVELSVGERIVVKVVDSKDRPVANADVTVKVGTREAARGKTYSDGSFSIYPLEYVAMPDAVAYRVDVVASAGKGSLDLPRKGQRSATLRLAAERKIPAPLPVDILFVMDTTGSMGEEIERLRATIEIIHTNLTALKPRPAIRFGLVLYKDREDEYVTEVHPFTADLDAFQKVLDGITADGGGDTPEDLQAALKDAVRGMDWNEEGLRLAFAVTDAQPQLYADEAYNYASAAREAREKGIKIFTIGTGGLPIEGEYVLRQLAQFTQGKYIFLTYGEKIESEGGREGSVSHHSGENFTTDKLEAVVIRFVKEELSRFSEKSLAYDESFYEANRIADEKAEDTLAKLFTEALQNLADYSTYRIETGTRLAVMPIAPPAGEAGAALAPNAEYFGAELARAASVAKLWTVVERKDLQQIMKELELQLAGLADEETAAKVGKILGAEVLVSGSIYRKDGRFEIFLKLVRVETAEVLSATKAKIDEKLGL